VSLAVEVFGENLSVLVHGAILNHRIGAVENLVVVAQTPREEEDLGVESPLLHVLIKVGQIGIIIHGLVKGFPTQLLAEKSCEGGFAHSHVAGNGDEPFHTRVLLLFSFISSRQASSRSMPV
jgi:hypothetical protein